MPGCVFVFNLASNKLACVATITSHEAMRITKLGDHNQMAVPATYAIGKTLAHYAQPRWTDYWGFDGKQMIAANGLWSQQFRHWPAELKRLLEQHPDDAELWYYLGRAYEALGNGNEARLAMAKSKSLGYKGPDWKLIQAGLLKQPDAGADGNQPLQ
jgi:hypothetical protein